MRRKTGLVCMVLGIALIIASAALLIHNIVEGRNAAEASENVLNQMELVSADGAMIDGYEYIGVLTIPALGLELPVMDRWDYTRLKLAPCLYYGSAETGDMVIAAHNYDGHFGRLSQLAIGDQVLFTDMDENTYAYQVGNMEVLPPDATEQMIESDWDLTLYTCTYGGKNRITVRCRLIDEAVGN